MTDTDLPPTPETESRCPRERTGLPRPRKRHWRIALLMVLIFLAGGVLGVAGTVIYTIRHLQEIGQHPERAPQRITDRMQRKLDLTDAQAEAVREILERRQHELMAIRREIHPRVKAIMDASRDEISEVLTDEQRAEWQEMYERFGERWMGPPDGGRRPSRRHRHRRPSGNGDDLEPASETPEAAEPSPDPVTP